MSDRDDSGIFRGSEMSRLAVLVAVALVGWAIVWRYAATSAGPPDPGPVVEGRPSPVEPDTSAEFETVTDKTPLGFRDSAAYDKLLGQAREATPAALASKARRDIQFAQLLERPGKYRGVPVHILGTARRVLRYESAMSKTGWLYEAWVVTDDSQSNPWVCVFEDAPKGLPIGGDVSERLVFNGYFLKLMAYQAGDKRRMAPLLVGRVGWTAPAGGGKVPTVYWFAAAVAVMFLISLFRWVMQFRRALAPRPVPSYIRHRPTEEIEPEALHEWLETVADDGEEKTGPPPR